MEQEIENADSPNGEEIVTEEVTTPEEETETVETLTEKNKKLYARAKKAEGFELVDDKWIKKPKVTTERTEVAPSQDGLSTKDVLFLAKADIHEEDMDEVLEWAKFKKVPVSEAYKQLKGVLEVKNEQRKTANATNISTARRSNSKVTDDVLIEKANKGDLPESQDDIDRLMRAKLRKKG